MGAKRKILDPLGITDLRIRGMWHIDNPNNPVQLIDAKLFIMSL